MLKRTIAALALVASLTACDAPSNPSVHAGSQAVPAANAASLFRQVCYANQTNLDAARGTIASLPFTRNSTEDIYYHNDLNLSFKLTPQLGGVVCSMVWASPDSPRVNEATIQSVAPGALFRTNPNGLLSTAVLGVS